MIEKILERLEERRLEYEKASENPSFEFPQKMYYKGVMRGYEYSKDVVQEVAKEHRKLNRCDTCNHYVADEVPPICYFCCKGFEDNYVAKEYGKDTNIRSKEYEDGYADGWCDCSKIGQINAPYQKGE